MLQKREISAGLMSLLARMQTLPYVYKYDFHSGMTCDFIRLEELITYALHSFFFFYKNVVKFG